MCDKYNGYTNYETWLVSLWLDNDPTAQATIKGMCSMDIKNYVETSQPVEGAINRPSLVADLINSALGVVNWKEIEEANNDYSIATRCY